MPRSLVLFVMLMAVYMMPAYAAERMVIGEMFTNTSWTYCYNADLVLDQLAVNHEADLTLIRYHFYYPSNQDPYYLYNSLESTARSTYYRNNYVPHLFIDGAIDAGYDRNSWEARINEESLNDAPLRMFIWGLYKPDSLSGIVNVMVITDRDPGLTDCRLRIALTESDIIWEAPNRGTVHNQTMRDMIPDTTGETVTLTIGDTLNYFYRFAVPRPLAPENCQLVAFVQSDQNRQILQGAQIGVSELLTQPCQFQPGDINNNGEFNGIDVGYSVNFLKGLGPAPGYSCACGPYGIIASAADANGNCAYNGMDVSYSVNYLKGMGPEPTLCPYCPLR